MINWKLRFQNKITLTSLVVLVISFIYGLLGLLGIVPPISENDITNIVMMIINILVALGVVVDPTTAGIGDSRLALTREHINVTKERL